MDELIAFARARLDEEEPARICGCLDTNHWPPCTPQPWADRKRREIAAWRAVLDAYTEAAADLKIARKTAPRRPIGDTDLIDAERELAILRPLAETAAAVWCDYPGYRQEWKP